MQLRSDAPPLRMRVFDIEFLICLPGGALSVGASTYACVAAGALLISETRRRCSAAVSLEGGMSHAWKGVAKLQQSTAILIAAAVFHKLSPLLAVPMGVAPTS
jgi:hypothetical protein